MPPITSKISALGLIQFPPTTEVSTEVVTLHKPIFMILSTDKQASSYTEMFLLIHSDKVLHPHYASYFQHVNHLSIVGVAEWTGLDLFQKYLPAII